MVVWVTVSFYRIMSPEEPRSPHVDGYNFRIPYTSDPVREPVLIGARSIRDHGRTRARVQSIAEPYDFLDGHSDGFPEAWWEDVLRRSN